MGRHARGRVELKDDELARAFAGAWGSEFPPVLNVIQAARLADVPAKTIYDWSHRQLLKGCAVRRGKRLRIFRDRFVRFLFSEQGC